LAVISGLFDLQLMYDKDPRLKELLTNSKNRIKSMSLIHESLYHQSNVSKIDLRTYIGDLVNEIAKTHYSKRPVRLQFELDEVYLDLSQSIPCGLIINEVVSNCFKHAFEISENPIISISLKLNQKIELVIKDNGSGIDLANSEDINSLGMTLIDAFTRQLEGDFSYRIENGTEFSLNFDCAT
jgi:two-component sensor histidine kinase